MPRIASRTLLQVVAIIGCSLELCHARELAAAMNYDRALKTCTQHLKGAKGGCDFNCPKNSCVKEGAKCVRDFTDWCEECRFSAGFIGRAFRSPSSLLAWELARSKLYSMACLWEVAPQGGLPAQQSHYPCLSRSLHESC